MATGGRLGASSAVAARPTKAWALRRTARLLVDSAWERAGRAGVREIPRSPDEVSAQWLTGALCAGTAAARVRSVAGREPSAGTTTRKALEITYNEAGAAAGLPTQAFVKCTTTLVQRLMLGLGGFIHGEPGFYAQVRPQLEIEAPLGYFAAVDERSWHSVVLIEDVTRTRGASFWQPAATVTRQQMENLLSNAAAWHGALWENPQLAEWRWLKTPAEQMGVIDALIGMADRVPAGARRARALIPPALRRRQVELYPAMRRSMRLASRGPRTYLHGDLHIANTYFTDQGNGGVTDWQAGLQGSWAFDYAYLVASGLAVEDRRAWEHELLDFYLEHLAAAGGGRVAREEGWLAYRQATFYPYFAWLYTIGRSRLQPRFQPDAISAMVVERIAVAIDDLDSLGAIDL